MSVKFGIFRMRWQSKMQRGTQKVPTYIEAGKTGVSLLGESSSNKGGKGNGNGKKENSTTMKEENLSCNHYMK